MSQIFNITNYKKLLKYINNSKFNFKTFKDNLSHGRNIIMRHDIDFCPERALDLAIIENSNSVISTYFFLINTEFYNLNAKINQKIIKKIINLGHEVGLHFDASLYTNKNDLIAGCKREISALEKIISKNVYIISFHRPSKNILNLENSLSGINHTYMKKFTKDIEYCSDSQGKWRFKRPQEIISKNENNEFFNLQLLTHPIWWTTPARLSPAEKVDFHLKKKYSYINKLAAFNCKPYLKYLKLK